MKKLLTTLGLLSLIPLLASAGDITSLTGTIQTETSNGMKAIYFLLKVAGFGVIMWGIADLMADDQRQGNGGGKYIHAALKIIVGALFIAGQSLGTAILGESSSTNGGTNGTPNSSSNGGFSSPVVGDNGAIMNSTKDLSGSAD